MWIRFLGYGALLVFGIPFVLWFAPQFAAMHPQPCHPACECVCPEGGT